MDIIVSLTIGVIVFTLCALNLAQAWVIYGLLNRLLMQAKVPILDLPQRQDKETHQPEDRKTRFTVHVPV